jgi:hypothetical protein
MLVAKLPGSTYARGHERGTEQPQSVAQAATGAQLLERARVDGLGRAGPDHHAGIGDGRTCPLGRHRDAGVQRGRAAPSQGGVGRLAHIGTVLIARVNAPPSTCEPPAKRTVSGPSNGSRTRTSKRSPGAMPRSAR